ncbi:MAG: nucleotide sugar dehydrogenase [Haloarculaceae archaeon]
MSGAALGDAFEAGDVPAAVYGLGKMGLPLAAVYAETTGAVVGADVDDAVVASIRRGESPVVEPGLDDLVGDLVEQGALAATTDPTAAAARSSVHVVIVPTLLDGTEPDLSTLEDAVCDVAVGLEPGDLVVVESTVPPRTCVDRLEPLLAAESGLASGEFGLAVCPERTASGRALDDIRGAHPKVVGGVDAESTRVAAALYDRLTDAEVLTVSTATTAEAVKVFEGIYRDVNIALANELGRHAGELGIDVTEAIETANTQPYCDIHRPGAGVGGHCIPYYPHFLASPFETDTPLLETARAVNESMPGYTAQAALDGLVDVGLDPADARVLVLGATYRPGVDELRATPAVPVVERLSAAGADVVVTDPVASDLEPVERAGATSRPVGGLAAADPFDAVVLVTPQAAFESLDVPALGGEDRRLVVVDGRQALTELRDRDAVQYRGVGVNV